jgi:hypothetical protein
VNYQLIFNTHERTPSTTKTDVSQNVTATHHHHQNVAFTAGELTQKDRDTTIMPVVAF